MVIDVSMLTFLPHAFNTHSDSKQKLRNYYFTYYYILYLLLESGAEIVDKGEYYGVLSEGDTKTAFILTILTKYVILIIINNKRVL
jgi:hypothetical protein